MMKKISAVFLFSLLLVCSKIYSQEIITSLRSNQLLQQESMQLQSSAKLKSGAESGLPYSQLLQLPFYDDFARPQYYPTSSLWADKNAFVNTAWGVNPPNIGVVSLDALDANGKLYSTASSFSFEADALTSLPLNLANYTQKVKSNALFCKDGVGYRKISDTMYYKRNGVLHSLLKSPIWFEAQDTVYYQNGKIYSGQIFVYDGTNYIELKGASEHKNYWTPYSVSDSLLFTFYFQAGGNTYMQNHSDGDSLVLEYYTPSSSATGIKINEITNSWVELYNADDKVANLSGYYLTSRSADSTIKIPENASLSSVLSSALIPPFGHLLINTTSLSEFADFPKKQHIVILYDAAKKFVDSIGFDKTSSINAAIARIPDGGAISFQESTPAAPNGNWSHIWAADTGTTSTFTQVVLPVDAKYFAKGFRFRFRSYSSLSDDASMARNEDVWNIDNVYFSANLRKSQPNYPDVGFASNYPNILRGYSSVPYKHLENLTTDVTDVFVGDVKSFDPEQRKVYFRFVANKRIGTPLFSDTLDFKSVDLPKYDNATFGLYNAELNTRELSIQEGDLSAFIKRDCSTDTVAVFDLKCLMKDDESPLNQPFRWNDTIRRSQYFLNYYSYDDGTPEAGYGIQVIGLGKVAYQFSMLKADVLTGIKIYFNPTLNSGYQYFNLCIWVDSLGRPGRLLYRHNERVLYSDGVYQFVNYPIVSEGFVNSNQSELTLNGTYYVGWIQTQGYFSVGLDVNSSVKSKLYYSVDNDGWGPSKVSNALMIRPLFGRDVVGGNEISDRLRLSVFPNPANDVLQFSDVNFTSLDTRITIQSIDGQTVYEGKYSLSINIAKLPSGVYSGQVISPSGENAQFKFIKQ